MWPLVPLLLRIMRLLLQQHEQPQLASIHQSTQLYCIVARAFHRWPLVPVAGVSMGCCYSELLPILAGLVCTLIPLLVFAVCCMAGTKGLL